MAYRISESRDVVEPPRDGEFFIEEANFPAVSARATRKTLHLANRLQLLLERHPVLALGAAIGVGVIATSVLMKLPF